jgi:hypothetical protein
MKSRLLDEIYVQPASGDDGQHSVRHSTTRRLVGEELTPEKQILGLGVYICL